ncbi:hypothetical protein NDN08_003580 [Rhodosorus marinus]|uniref:Uncharacterized protein n=1 Tax=Rhodosorus marinus TaxID=101924 RepID=A0AAV8UWX5_9RHOD|nr:hypothetical protein NDN08_003580 [Rhodosorus marinus]
MDPDETLVGGLDPLVNESEDLIQLCSGIAGPPRSAKLDDFKEIQTILEKYQEKSQLLDPLLPRVTSSIIEFLLANDDAGSQAAFRALYTLFKVRGFKNVARHLPHTVNLFETVACRLLNTPEENEAS